MYLTKQNGGIKTFRNDLDTLFDGFFDSFPVSSLNNHFTPKVNITEDDKSYHIEAELAGVKKDDISVDYSSGILTIKADKKEEKEDKKKNYHKVESYYGTFSRSIKIPSEIDYSNVAAAFTDGVLKVELPKTESKKAKIAIK